MPRKKRISGRARPTTPESKLLITVEKVNRRLKQLDVNQVYGTYSVNKMLKAIRSENKIDYRRGRSQKIRVNVRGLTKSQQRYYQKVFETFLDSKTSSVLGLIDSRTRTRAKLKRSLGNIVDRKMTDEDIDDFYDLVTNDDFRYLADKIGDSEVYILLNYAKENQLSEPKFEDLMRQYITTNNVDVRRKAERLYDKFIIGM